MLDFTGQALHWKAYKFDQIMAIQCLKLAKMKGNE